MTNAVQCKYSYDKIKEALTVAFDSDSIVAESHTGVNSATIRRWRGLVKTGNKLVGSDGKVFSGVDYQIGDIPSPDLPIEEVIEMKGKAFDKKMANNKAVKWLPINMKSNEPIMVCFVGDPHLDDDGCNWPILNRDIEIFKQPKVYCVNIGDTINNWAGRLAKLYAEQESSQHTAVRLGRWFVKQARWLIWIRGNHDMWTPSGVIDMEAEKVSHVANWEAKFDIVFPNGKAVKVHSAHNFKGTSIYNKLHGGMKQAKFSGTEADIYVSGHHHEWDAKFGEDENNHRIFTVMKVRGYKFDDEFALVHGFGEQKHGSTIGVVIDPNEEGSCSQMVFSDIALGAKYLKYLRGTYETSTTSI